MSRLPGAVFRKGVMRVAGVCLQLAIVTFALTMHVTAATAAGPGSQVSTSGGDASPGLIELAQGWRLTSTDKVTAADSTVSSPEFDTSHWYEVRHMPATVLQALEDDGVYRDLYFGMNLTTPGDLWKKDWWYRTTFNVPAGHPVYSLIFKGINYRAEIWLNGKKVAENNQVVGMYNSFEFDVSKLVHPGESNVLAVRITPEQSIPHLFSSPVGSEGTVELGDTWL